jgi:hypothetical protein
MIILMFNKMKSVGILQIGYPSYKFKLRQGTGCKPTHRHVSCSSGSYLPAKVAFGAAMCPSGSGTRLPAKVSSNVVTCTVAPDPLAGL